MKKLSLTMLMFFGVLALSVNLQAQTTSTVKAEKKSCQQPCSKTAQADAQLSYFPYLTAAAPEEKTQTTSTAATTEKANCQKVCTGAAMAKVNCDPKDCPPGCVPANCKIKTCAPGSTSATAVSVNQKPGNQK